MAQKNFKLEEDELAAFEEWCRANNYNERRVFLAGWRLLTTISHDERMVYFDGLDDWVKCGVSNGDPAKVPEPVGANESGEAEREETARSGASKSQSSA